MVVFNGRRVGLRYDPEARVGGWDGGFSRLTNSVSVQSYRPCMSISHAPMAVVYTGH